MSPKVLLNRLRPIERELKETTFAVRPASYLDLNLKIDSEGRLKTKRYDKRDGFNFAFVNFPGWIRTTKSPNL
jgi:hypothetical protein